MGYSFLRIKLKSARNKITQQSGMLLPSQLAPNAKDALILTKIT